MPSFLQLAAAVLLTASAGVPEGALSFQARARAVLVVLTPKGTTPGVSSATLLDAASAELEALTDLELESMEQAGVDEVALRACPKDRPLGCLVNLLTGATGAEPTGAPKILLVVSLYSIEQDQQVLHTSMIDLPSAHRSYVQIRDQGDEDWGEQAEDAIYRSAAHAEPVQSGSLDSNALRAYFAARVDRDFRALLEQGKHFARLGQLEISGTPNGLRVVLDGRLLGMSQWPETRIVDVPTGAHDVELAGADGAIMQARVMIGAQVSARLEYVPPPPPASAFRVATFWSSLGLGAVGAALSIVGAAQSGAAVATGCVIPAGADPAACPNLGLPTFGFSPSRAPTADLSELNPGGLSTAALGLGLLGAGAFTAASIALFGEPEDSPWAQIAAGIALGLTTAVVVTLADPRENIP